MNLKESMSSNNDTPDVLLVEDNLGDIRLTQVAFQDAEFDVKLHTATTGPEAIDFLRIEELPHPDLVLLDLNLPRKDGLDVLEEIRNYSELKHLPVLMLTSSTATEDIVSCYKHYANAYLTKPERPEMFVELVRTIERFWFEVARLPPCP